MSSDRDRSRRRQLLLVTHRPLEYAGPGSVRWRYLLGKLPELGWEVRVVSSRHNPTRDELSDDPREARLAVLRARVMHQVGRAMRPAWNRAGIQPEAFPPNTLWSFTGRGLIRRRAEELRADAVVATIPPPAALFAMVGALGGKGKPLVVDMRDNWAGHPTYDAGGRMLARIEDQALRRVDAVVAVSEGMRAKLLRMHPWLGPRLHLMPNGYDPRLLERRPPPLERWPERITLIHPGVLYGDRSLAGLITAMSRPSLRDRLRLEIIGNIDAATAAAIRAKPPGVLIDSRPPAPWEATMERVREAHVMITIVPYTMGDDVAWPVKNFEAFALGMPVLSITTGGATEGLLRDLGADIACARDGDVESIAAALERLLAAPPPPPLAPERVRRFDRSVVAGDYAALLDGLVEGR
jgi:glycosyltransferase involved in cell wall biosynthesis